MNEKKILYFFTATYPFGSGEQFLQNEISELSKYFNETYLVPYIPQSLSEQFILPGNVYSLNAFKKRDQSVKNIIFKNFSLFLKIFLSDLFQKKGLFTALQFRNITTEIANAIYTATQIEKFLEINKDSTVFFHSTWMNEWALSLAILYHKKKINNFSFKMRGYDLFDERRKHGYMPFRKFIFKNSSKQLTVSRIASEYLKNKGYPDCKVNYSGIEFFKNSANFTSEASYTLVSCSNLIPIKRVNLIAESLNYVNLNLKWVHFGDGLERNKIEAIIQQLPKNIKVELKGNVTNLEVINFYKNNLIDAFIHLSETEGFGYAILEAFSCGIPAILYPGGAVAELINPEYCEIITDKNSIPEIGKKIQEFVLYSRENPNLRNRIYEVNEQKFNKAKLGSELYNHIITR